MQAELKFRSAKNGRLSIEAIAARRPDDLGAFLLAYSDYEQPSSFAEKIVKAGLDQARASAIQLAMQEAQSAHDQSWTVANVLVNEYELAELGFVTAD